MSCYVNINKFVDLKVTVLMKPLLFDRVLETFKRLCGIPTSVRTRVRFQRGATDREKMTNTVHAER